MILDEYCYARDFVSRTRSTRTTISYSRSCFKSSMMSNTLDFVCASSQMFSISQTRNTFVDSDCCATDFKNRSNVLYGEMS